MKEQLRYGRFLYISFVAIDLVCLVLANKLASFIYLNTNTSMRYGYARHRSVVIIMIVIDLAVTFALDTLNRVLRRRKRIEMAAGIKHVGISFVLLSAVLFTLRIGAFYSRVIVYLAYVIYYLLFVGSHIVWKHVLKLFRAKGDKETAILMTTDRFVDEGVEMLSETAVVTHIFLLKNIRRNKIGDIPVVKTAEEAAAILCWNWIDKAYVYGLDHQMIPDTLTKACWEMDIELRTVNFEYKVLELKTIPNEDPKYGALSFLEGKRDIPFPIRRVYWITETEANLHRGFHAHKLNCQLLFCPYGKIDIILDDGKDKVTITLEGPGKGLLLMPGMWREMVWQETGSVLCVLASEYYDPDEYIRNYDEFIAYREKTISESDDILISNN